MFGGQTFGATFFGGIFPWLRDQARTVTGWGPPAVTGRPLTRKDAQILSKPLLTRAVGRPPTVNPPDPVREEEEALLVLLSAL